MDEMTEERAQIIDLKRRLRDMKEERDRYLSSYVQLLEKSGNGIGVAAKGPWTVKMHAGDTNVTAVFDQCRQEVAVRITVEGLDGYIDNIVSRRGDNIRLVEASELNEYRTPAETHRVRKFTAEKE